MNDYEKHLSSAAHMIASQPIEKAKSILPTEPNISFEPIRVSDIEATGKVVLRVSHITGAIYGEL